MSQQCLLFLLLAIRPFVSAASDSKLLDVSQTRTLVIAALPETVKRLPGLDVAPGPVEKDRCVTLEVLWANPGVGSAHVDFYTVDLHTGAIWRGVTGLLSLISSPSLRTTQRKLWKVTGACEADYQDAVKKHQCGY